MEPVGVVVGVLNLWHFAAAYTQSLPHRYDPLGRLLVALFGVSVCFLPYSRLGGCWLVAMMVDVIGYHGIPRPEGYTVGVWLVVALCLAHDYITWVVSALCVLWLGLVWQVNVRKHYYDDGVSLKVAGVWTLLVVLGGVGVVDARFTGCSVLLYTLLFTGRFIPGTFNGETYRVPSGSDSSSIGSGSDSSDGLVAGLGSSSSSERWDSRARYDVQGLLDDCFHDSGCSFQEEWSSLYEDGNRVPGVLQPREREEGMQEQDDGRHHVFVDV